jgi:hypothetical protein
MQQAGNTAAKVSSSWSVRAWPLPPLTDSTVEEELRSAIRSGFGETSMETTVRDKSGRHLHRQGSLLNRRSEPGFFLGTAPTLPNRGGQNSP